MTRLKTSLRFRFDSCFNRFSFYYKCKRLISTPNRVLILFGIIVVFINEFFVYQWYYLNWPNIKELAKKPSVEKLLIVADPQLIGEKDEGILGFITRKDSDRYIAKTFPQAKSYVKPDWIIFLGDIFDEGLSASDDEFQRYFQRFDSIFNHKNNEHRHIVIPGDNDVGGEYSGDNHPLLRERFRNYFGRLIALYHQNDVEFLKLDVDMYESYAEGKSYTIRQEMQNHPMTAIFRIVLNHWPILMRTNRFVKPFINDVEPNIILKGDSHHFTITSYDRITMTNRVLVEESLPEPFYSIDLNNKNYVHEISIPTCSYRMGVERMGYGVLLLDSESKTIHLTILPTPRRYLLLYFYAISVIFGIIFYIFTAIFPRRHRLIKLAMLSHAL